MFLLTLAFAGLGSLGAFVDHKSTSTSKQTTSTAISGT